MELAEPSIATALARCAAQKADVVVVFPYFLGPGHHVEVDIPALVKTAASNYPDLQTRIAKPFGLHDLLLEVIRDRVAESLEKEA